MFILPAFTEVLLPEVGQEIHHPIPRHDYRDHNGAEFMQHQDPVPSAFEN